MHDDCIDITLLYFYDQSEGGQGAGNYGKYNL